MNKLAVLALSALLLLGGLLWYLAGNSLTPYINQYISQLNTNYPSTHIVLTEVNIEHAKSLTTAKTLSIEEIDSVSQSKPTQLILNGISIAFDPKSFKKDVVIIKYVVINEANLLVDDVNYLTQIDKLASKIELMLAEQTEEISTGLLKNHEPVIKINKITLANLHVTMYKKEDPLHEKIFTNLSISFSEEPKAVSFAVLNLLKDLLKITRASMADS